MGTAEGISDPVQGAEAGRRAKGRNLGEEVHLRGITSCPGASWLVKSICCSQEETEFWHPWCTAPKNLPGP